MRRFDTIIVHHSAGNPSATVEDIMILHVGRGWRDIGYHYVITADGMIHQARPLQEQGAHCKGHNATSVGVCVTGDNTVPGREWNNVQRSSLRRFLDACAVLFPNATIHGHREFSNTLCPGLDRSEWFGGTE